MRISDWSSDVCSSDLSSHACGSPSENTGCSAAPLDGASSTSSDLCSRDLGTQISPDASALASRSEEHTSELQSLMRISYAVFCLKKKRNKTQRKSNSQSNIREKISPYIMQARHKPQTHI